MSQKQPPAEEEFLITEPSYDNHDVPHEIITKGLCRNKYLIAASLVAAVGGVLFGYDMGVMSGALTQLKVAFKLSCFEQEMTISSLVIGALITSVFAGFFVDYFGRKLSIVAASLLYAFGAIIAAVSPSYSVLIFGRVILGSAVALSSASECVYVSEISPAPFRGTLVSFNELGITIGFLLAYCANAGFAYDTLNGWRWMFGLSLIFAAIMIGLVCWLPYSPRHLLLKGRVDDAKATLAKLRQCDPNSESFINEWSSMKSHICRSNTLQSNAMELFQNPSHAYSVFIAFTLMVIQQMTGQPNLLFYASTVLVSFGFPAGTVASVCTVGLGFAKLLSTITCISIVEKFERKTFLVVGSLVMAVSLLVIACSSIVVKIGVIESCVNSTDEFTPIPISSVDAGGVRWVVLLSLVMFVSGYAFSFGPVSWIFLSEIFPTNVRGKAFSLAISLNWLVQLILALTFLDFASTAGSVGWPFLLNSLFTFCSAAFLFKFIPKTRGKTLEEIQDDMKSLSGTLPCINPSN